MITRFEGTTKVADVTSTPLTIDDIYPIGIIVCGAKPTVGTWEKVEGKFLLGSSSSHKAGSTGGEETHKLTINEMPSHSHNFSTGYAVWGPTATNLGFAQTGGNWTGSDTAGGIYAHTVSTGGGQAHNNMPPYLSVDMWRRTA